MKVRAWTTIAVCTAGLVVLAPAAAGAAPGPPTTTPAETGGGCRENGQAISGAARTVEPFGAMVRVSTPIAEQNAVFFTLFCGPSPE